MPSEELSAFVISRLSFKEKNYFPLSKKGKKGYLSVLVQYHRLFQHMIIDLERRFDNKLRCDFFIFEKKMARQKIVQWSCIYSTAFASCCSFCCQDKGLCIKVFIFVPANVT